MMTQTRKTFSGNKARKELKQRVGRYPSGQIKHADRGEKPEEIMSVAVNARVRLLGVKKKDAHNARLATALGRLSLTVPLTAGQYAAGEKVARVMSLVGMLDDVKPAFGTPVLARLLCASGRDPYDAYDPDRAWDEGDRDRRIGAIMKARRDYADLTREAWEMEAQLETRGAWHIIQCVVLWDDQFAAAGDAATGLLRCGLNRLVHLWNLKDQT